jgi:hypothetical protein
MRAVVLPKWIEPSGLFDLIRLGRDRDGGYLVDARDVSEADFLISFGVNDDWSFEEDFLAIRNIPLHAFDGTIDRKVLALKVAKAAATGKNLRHKLKAFFEYGRFFRGNRHHHGKMVGLELTPGYVSLAKVLDEHGSSGRVFLKFDIEGWEYRILDDILAVASRITGLMIEFHDFDLHRDRVESFIDGLPLRVAHVHYNSYAPLDDQGTPLTIEVTFSSHAPIAEVEVKLPHPLDRLSAPDHVPSDIRFVG